MSNVGWIDIDPLDGGVWEIFSKRERLISAGTSKRQQSQITCSTERRGGKLKQPRVAVGQRVVVGLELSWQGERSSADRSRNAASEDFPTLANEMLQFA
jgi:hypothetical protein